MSAKTIAILVGPEYEDLEVWYPKLRLEAAGYSAPLVGTKGVTFAGKHGYPALVERDLTEMDPANLGWHPCSWWLGARQAPARPRGA
jgi:protease I